MVGLPIRELEHEICIKSIYIPLDPLTQCNRLNFIKHCQIAVQHDSMAANQENAAFNQAGEIEAIQISPMFR